MNHGFDKLSGYQIAKQQQATVVQQSKGGFW